MVDLTDFMNILCWANYTYFEIFSFKLYATLYRLRRPVLTVVTVKRSMALWFWETYRPDKCRGSTKVRELLIQRRKMSWQLTSFWILQVEFDCLCQSHECYYVYLCNCPQSVYLISGFWWFHMKHCWNPNHLYNLNNHVIRFILISNFTTFSKPINFWIITLPLQFLPYIQ